MNKTPNFSELQRKAKPELQAIFRQASQAAQAQGVSQTEREAARQTLDMVRRCLSMRP